MEQTAVQDRSDSDIGPEHLAIAREAPSSMFPPDTDHGEVQTFWASFASAHRRIQNGGWSRQITVEDFPISKDIAGVNMRLTAGGVRELHWHAAGEWGIVLAGGARLTALDDEGKGFVDDVSAGDVWFFPTGNPHSIQGLNPDGCEFLLVFDDGTFSEGNTTLISDWLRRCPRDVLAKNWQVRAEQIEPVYQTPQGGKYIFQAAPPGSLEDDRAAIAGMGGLSKVEFTFRPGKMAPTIQSQSGQAKVIDSKNFAVSKAVAAAHVVVKSGGLRELHWHQNADEWQYYIAGKGRMTVFFNGGKARTADFAAGDVGYVPKTFGHYVENTGDGDLVYLEMFKAAEFKDLSLSQWVTHVPPVLLKSHIGVSMSDVLSELPRTKTAIVPA